MGFKRIASVRWEGDLMAGKGSMSTPHSGLFAEIANAAKSDCVVSRAPAVPVTMEAALA